MSNGLYLDPTNQTVVVTITAQTTGASVPLFSDANTLISLSNPFTLAANTPQTVYTVVPALAFVSMKVSGVEAATPAGTSALAVFSDGGIGSLQLAFGSVANQRNFTALYALPTPTTTIPAWAASTVYATVGQAVTNSGYIWLNKSAHTSTTAFPGPANWVQLASAVGSTDPAMPTITIGPDNAVASFGANTREYQFGTGTVSGQFALPALSGAALSGDTPPSIRFRGGQPALVTTGGRTWLQNYLTGYSGSSTPPYAALEFGHFGSRVAIGIRTSSYGTLLFKVDGKFVSTTATNLSGSTAMAYATIDFGRTVTDAVTTSGSNVLTSASGNFTAADIGQPVVGAGIPVGSMIFAVTSSTSVTLAVNVRSGANAANATVTASGVAVYVSKNAMRHIEVIGVSHFYGIVIGSADSLNTSPRPRTARWLTVGDSYFSGTGATTIHTGVVQQVMAGLGIDDYMLDALGGTGAIATNGSSANYLTRVNNTLSGTTAGGTVPATANPGTFTGVLISGSINDSPSTSTALTTQGNAIVDAIRALYPSIPIVIPVFSSANPVTTGQANVLAGWQGTAAARTNVYVLNLQDVLTGTGYPLSTVTMTGTGNSDLFRHSDGAHWAQPGWDYLAMKVVRMIQATVPGFSAN